MATIADYEHEHEHEFGRAMTKPAYVRVVIDRAIHRELDYLVPETLAERVGIGSRVRVPFRERSALATVVALLEQSEAEGSGRSKRSWARRRS